MKRILPLLLSIFIMVGCIMPLSVLGVNDKSQRECYTEAKLLVSLGIFEEAELQADLFAQNITRGEFAQKLATLLKKQGYAGDKVYFYDAENLTAVNDLAAAGIFKGNPDGHFYPERNITKQEAAIALTRALGYEEYVLARGGTVSEYVLLANRLELISDITTDEELSVAEAILCLYNLLFSKAYEIQSISNDGVIYNEGQKLLWTLYKTMRVYGAVTADMFTGIYNSSALAEDRIAINEKVYKTTVKEPWEYIGQNVTAFVKIDNDFETVTCIVPDEEKNETITLYPGQFSYNNYVIEYEAADGRASTITLPNTMVVIKNHQLVTEGYDEAFAIKTGKLRLYKNEYINPTGYCVAVIDSAETAIIQSVDFAYNIIYTNNDNINAIDCNKTEGRYIDMVIEPSGNGVSLVQLKYGQLIEVYASENGMFTKIYLCTDNISGTITSISGDDNKTIVGIDGKDYEVSRGFIGASQISVGLTAEFYFDTQGKVAYYLADNTDAGTVYGYVYDATMTDGAFSRRYLLKIFNENGQHIIFEISDNPEVDGATITAEQAYRKFINPGTGETERQLVIFKTNKEGKISYIDTPADDQASREAEGTLWEAAELGSYKFNYNLLGFEPKYPIRGKHTKVFVIPQKTVEEPTERHFAAMTYVQGNPFSLGRNHNVALYKKTTTNPYMDVVLYELADIPEYMQHRKLLVVDEIYGVYDEANDDTYVSMDCYVTKYKENLNFAPEVMITKLDHTSVRVRDTEVSNYIGQGDILHYSENAIGEISRISLIYDYDANKTEWGEKYSNYNDPGAIYRTEGLILADVAKVYRDSTSSTASAMITVGRDGVLKEYISVLPSQFQAIVYDSSLPENKFYIGGLDDLVSLEDTANAECSRIFIQRSALAYATFVIYK